MKFYLVSLAVLVLQAVGAPALARDIADNAALMDGIDAELASPVAIADKPARLSKTQWRAATRIWGLEVMRKASRLYVEGPLREGLSGTSTVKFEVRSDGSLDQCHVVRSSGARALDEVACQAVMQASPGPVLLDELGQAQSVWAVLPVRFVEGDKLELEEGAP